MPKSKLLLIVPLVVLAALGGVYQFVLSKPAAKAKPKVDGQVYILPKEFLVNLADGRFVKLNVALVLDQSQELKAAASGDGSAQVPDGFGPLPQEAVVRDLVTDTLTDAKARDLIDRDGRQTLKRRVLRAIDDKTDVKVKEVLFTDIAVQ